MADQAGERQIRTKFTDNEELKLVEYIIGLNQNFGHHVPLSEFQEAVRLQADGTRKLNSNRSAPVLYNKYNFQSATSKLTRDEICQKFGIEVPEDNSSESSDDGDEAPRRELIEFFAKLQEITRATGANNMENVCDGMDGAILQLENEEEYVIEETIRKFLQAGLAAIGNAHAL